MRFLLITVCEREIYTEFFDTYEEAHDAMLQDMKDTPGCPNDVDFTRDIVNDYDDIGYDAYSGWINGRCESDWRIVPV